MEITVLKKPVDGLLEMRVSLYEFTDGKGKSVEVTVWVPDHDSRSSLEVSARIAAADQLRRAISALESEGP